MGYSYSKHGICCDKCGASGREAHVRKRTCTAKVLTSTHKTYGNQRQTLPWCSPPALCTRCFHELGGSKVIHAKCSCNAARAQQEYDDEQMRLDSGDSKVSARWGDWHEDVPEGYVGAVFTDRNGNEAWILCDQYDEKKMWLSEVATQKEWENHPGCNSKEKIWGIC